MKNTLARSRSAFAVLALLLVSVSVDRAQTPAAIASDIPKIEFEKYTLPNGLEVILSEDHRLPMVAVNLWYHVGPANEAPGRTGFAHLFEHMMFQGSKHVASDAHFRILEGAGASDINGTTDFDRTNYFETIPANQLELAVWIESDRLGYLLDKVDQGALANQQDVVRNERRQSVENQPYGIAEEAMFHQLFPKTHPYYASVIGSHADIQAARLDDVQKFFKQYYSPNNASLAIVGDIDKAAAKALVEKYFGPLKRGPGVPPITATTPSIDAERRQTVTDRIELPRLYMAWITSPFFKPGDADADITAGILGGGKSSRLYKRLVYDKQIAQQVSAQQYSLILGSVFDIEITARPGHTAQELEAALEAELDTFRTNDPTVQEVERARNAIETRIVQGLETLGGFGGVADRLNMYNHFLHDPGYLPSDVARYRAVSPESVRRFAQDRLKKNTRVVILAVPGPQDLGTPVPTPPPAKTAPGQGAESINPDAPWRSEMPKAASSKPLTLPVPQTFRLPNGLTVLYTERTGLPIVSANLVVRTGSENNPLDRPGLANFTAAMLNEGTTTRSALQIADESAQLGASLSTSSTMDSSQLTLRTLKNNFPAALALMADLVLHPSFPQEEIERQQKSRLGSLAQQRENPTLVANTVMAAALFGNQHPYGFTEIGTERSIQTISRDELMAFWKQNFVPNNAALVVAGSISGADLKSVAERTFGAWQSGTAAKPATATPAATSARLVIVDKPGAPQTQVRIATIGARRSTPEYPQMQVLNEIVGGLFSSRINMNLREQHGYTYGAFSRFVYRRGAGPFYVSTGVRTDVTGPSVGEILKELQRMIDAPITSDELTLARDSIVRSLPADFETSARAASVLANLYVYDLGLDYYARFPETVAAVGRESVLGVARKYLAPNRMIVVVVGDRAKIEPELAKLNLGRVEVRDADGVVKDK
jgi:zinc protease